MTNKTLPRYSTHCYECVSARISESELRFRSYGGLKLKNLIVINLIQHGPICIYKKFNKGLNVKLHGQIWLSGSGTT
jgi:hypothetical protein